MASVHSKAVAASSTAYSFIVYGDLRPGSGAIDSPYSSGWTHVRDRVIATPHAFDVVPGDEIQGLSGTDTLSNDLAKYDWLFKNMGTEQSVPHVYAPGNHENFASANYRSAWQQKINAARWRSYSYGGGTVTNPRTFVIQLSTEEPGYTGRIGLAGETSTSNSPQADWLVSTLRREAWNTNEYIVVEFHRPLADPKPGETMSDRTAVESLFAKYGVDLVINAHVHVYVRHMMPNGTPYLIIGNGGASLYGEGSWTHTTPGADVKSVVGSYGYADFSVQADGTMNATVYSVDSSTWAWQTADTFTVPQTTPTPTPTDARTDRGPQADRPEERLDQARQERHRQGQRDAQQPRRQQDCAQGAAEEGHQVGQGQDGQCAHHFHGRLQLEVQASQEGRLPRAGRDRQDWDACLSHHEVARLQGQVVRARTAEPTHDDATRGRGLPCEPLPVRTGHRSLNTCPGCSLRVSCR